MEIIYHAKNFGGPISTILVIIYAITRLNNLKPWINWQGKSGCNNFKRFAKTKLFGEQFVLFGSHQLNVSVVRLINHGNNLQY